MGRLEGADQHGACRTRFLADEIDAPVDAVGAIDIGKAGRAEHHLVARRRPAVRMRGRFGVMIGLDLDNDAADAVHQQRRADQIGSDLVHAAAEEGAPERYAQIGCGVISGNAAFSHSKRGREGEKCAGNGNMLKHRSEQAGRLRFPFKRIS